MTTKDIENIIQVMERIQLDNTFPMSFRVAATEVECSLRRFDIELTKLILKGEEV